MDTKEFEHMCDLLPLDVGWGEPITPELVQAIAAAAVRYSTPPSAAPVAQEGAGESVRRYAATGDYAYPVSESADGEFVLHDDYATLTAEVSRLTGELDAASARLHEVATLCATVEQERDAMARELTLHRSGYAYRRQTESLEQCRKECERLREVLVEVQATRYREQGMKVEQSYIHAKCDVDRERIRFAREALATGVRHESK